MPDDSTLHIALQDGFEGVRVLVSVNGRDVYEREDLWSDPRIGLADSFEVAQTEWPLVVAVRVPDAGLEGSITIETPATPFVGISIYEGQIRFRVSEGAFGYL